MDLNKEPNFIEKAKNLGNAVVDWANKDGFKKVSSEVFQQRKDICLACPHWVQEAYGGIGKCGLCGCSVGKLYIPSSVCPHNPPKWTAVSTN